MKTKRQAQREARRLFRLCLVEGSLDEGLVRAVVQQVIDAGRPGSLNLLTRFQRLVRLDRAAHGATVESVTPLPPDVRGSIEAGLARIYGRGVDTSTPPTRLCLGACGSPWAAMSTMAAFTAIWRNWSSGSSMNRRQVQRVITRRGNNTMSGDLRQGSRVEHPLRGSRVLPPGLPVRGHPIAQSPRDRGPGVLGAGCTCHEGGTSTPMRKRARRVGAPGLRGGRGCPSRRRPFELQRAAQLE